MTRTSPTNDRGRAVRPRWRRTLAAVALATGCGVLATTVPASADLPGLLSGLFSFLTPPTATKVTPAPALPCGGPVLGATGLLSCTFSDEFTGSALDRTKWVPQESVWSGFTTGNECFVDDPDNVAVASGSLRLTVRRETASFACGGMTMRNTAGMVSTYERFGQAYGRYEIRARFPASTVKGLHEALWLWPADSQKYGEYPASGEIDIAEVYSGQRDRVIPYVHYNTADEDDPTVTNNWCKVSDVSQYHRYVLEWTTTSLRILIDDKVCVDHAIDPAAPLEAPQPFDQPFIILLSQALGIGDNAYTEGLTRLPATTYVDYVRVWG